MATITDRTTASQNGAVDETTPLIASESTLEAGQIENGEINGQNSDSNDSEKLPMVQIMLLCFARIAEPIAFFSIFPFIGQMIEDAAGVAESEVGFYSGLIESIFSFVQMLLMIPWGRAADKFGRKPVLVISMAGLSTASALFGTSRSIWEMIMYRSIAGMFSGSIVAVRASISENSTPKTQARAFSYFAFSNNLGICLSPFIGPVFSRPAEKYPSVFGGVQFFKDHPHALTTFTTGAIGATACIVSALFFKETLRKRPKGDANGSSPKTMTTTEIMKAPGVSRVLFVYTFTMLLALAYTAMSSWEATASVNSRSQCSSEELALLKLYGSYSFSHGFNGASEPVAFYDFVPQCGQCAFWTFAPFLLVVGSGVAMAFKS
ncbi:hypothetical protein ZTR_03088 [Talaromyces verruculosus]|nr:hypothetical protein ZTR_03088 [Talaromyces verruculosus]